MSHRRTALDREYSPSSRVPDADRLIDGYGVDSRAVRRRHPPTSHAYGPRPSETLDLFGAGPGSPAVVFFHGGYWQQLGKADASFPAPGLLAAGISYLAVDYGLAPAFTLDEIVDAARRAVGWVVDHAGALGLDPDRIVLAGSSAGAHLAAMVAVGGAPARGLVLCSGIYDLRPLVDTYVNDAVGMDAAAAVRNSPLLHRPDRRPPAVVVWGENETDAFKAQSRTFAAAWGGESFQVPGRNHFDLVYDLSDVDSPLGTAVRRLTRS